MSALGIMKGMIIGSLVLIIFLSVSLGNIWPGSSGLETHEVTEIQVLDHLKDGWYPATVNYSNPKKITMVTSKLKVEVKNDKVIKIDLGNGRVLKATSPEADYVYSGGNLSFEFDRQSQKSVATTSVKIKSSNGKLIIYHIRID